MLLKIVCDDVTFRINPDKIPRTCNLYKTIYENHSSDFLFFCPTEFTLYADIDPKSMSTIINIFRGYPLENPLSQNVVYDANRIGIDLDQKGGNDIFQQFQNLNDPAIVKVLDDFNKQFDISSSFTDHPYHRLSEEFKGTKTSNTKTSNTKTNNGNKELSATSDYVSEFTTEYRKIR